MKFNQTNKIEYAIKEIINNHFTRFRMIIVMK